MAICGCTYRGPTWQRWVFKPLTLLLLCCWPGKRRCSTPLAIWCWRGVCLTAGRCANPVATSTSDVPIGAFFLSHLLYTIYFASQMRSLSSGLCHWCCWFWVRCYCDYLDAAGRVPLAYLHVYRHALVMVWLAGELWFFRPTAPASLRLLALHCCLSVTLSGWVALSPPLPGR